MPLNDENTDLFRGLFHFHKIQPETIGNINRPNYDYSNLIVVVCGDPQLQSVKNICRTTMQHGGAVLIAADTEMSVSGFFPQAGDLQITGHRVGYGNPDVVDHGQAPRPFAVPLSVKGVTPFSGVERVATNAPSYLLSVRPPPGIDLKPVAAFPTGAALTNRGGLILPTNHLPLTFALATTDDRFNLRCMVMADQDVFSSRMIYTSGREQNPTDNLRFANNTVQWLKGNGRNKCLFVENGSVMPKFDEFEFSSIPIGPQIPPPPVPSIDVLDREFQQKVTDALNQATDQVQKNDMMNQGMLSLFRGSKALAIAALAVVLLFITYVTVRRAAIANWVRKTFRPIPRDPAMLGPDVPVGSLGHRRLELLRSADYGPVVRPVVWQLFQDRGLPGEYTGDKLPPLDIDVRRPQFLKESIQTLWAAVRSTTPIGFGKWKQLEPLLAAVRAAADDDRWRFVAPSPRDDAS